MLCLWMMMSNFSFVLIKFQQFALDGHGILSMFAPSCNGIAYGFQVFKRKDLPIGSSYLPGVYNKGRR